MVNSNGIEATVLKAKCGSDIRKQHLHHRNDVNYNDLVLMMQRIFSISPNESIQLKYKDSDGDWISIVDDNDIDFAIRTEPTFYVQVVTGSEQSESSNGTVNTSPDSNEKCNEVAAIKQSTEKNSKVDGIASSAQSQQGIAKEGRPNETLSAIGSFSSTLGMQKSATEQSWSTIANPPTPISQGGGVMNNVSDIISDSSSASQLMDSPKSASANSIATIQPSVQETVGGQPAQGFSTIYDGSTPPAQPAHYPPTSVSAPHQFAPPTAVGGTNNGQQFTAPTPPTTQSYYGGIQPPSGFTPPQHHQSQFNQATPPMIPQFGQQQQPTPPISSIIGKQPEQQTAYNQSPQLKPVSASATPVQSNIYGSTQPPALQPPQQQAGMFQQQQQNTGGQGFQQKAPQYTQYPQMTNQQQAQPPMQFSQQQPQQQAPSTQFGQQPPQQYQQQGPPPSSQPAPPSGIAPPPVSQFGNVSASGNPFARGPIGSRPASNFSNQY